MIIIPAIMIYVMGLLEKEAAIFSIVLNGAIIIFSAVFIKGFVVALPIESKVEPICLSGIKGAIIDRKSVV